MADTRIKEKAPTFKEFRAAVKASMWDDWPQLDEAEVERFLTKPRIAGIIQNRYNEAVEELEAGEITVNVFRNGSVASTGMCLGLMYTPD